MFLYLDVIQVGILVTLVIYREGHATLPHLIFEIRIISLYLGSQFTYLNTTLID